MARVYVDKYTGTIERTDLFHVRVTMKDGRVFDDLEVRRLFPISNRTAYISLMDEKELEAAFVRDLDELDDASREALEACFSEFYMIPKILSVIAVEDRYGVLKWTVETDCGTVTFGIRNRNSDIKRLECDTHILIRDSNDNRYEIPDTSKLDKHSSRMLFSYL